MPAPARDDEDLVVVPEHVLLLREQVRHCLAGSNVGQEPERVLEVRQEPDIGVREWRAGAHSHGVDLRGQVSAADEVEPLLNVGLVRELGVLADALCLEELVEVELVELALIRNGDQLVRHLVGEQAHLRERPVRVPGVRMRDGVLGLGALLVGVGPVEDLLLDELTGCQRLERRARQVQVGAGSDRQEVVLVVAELVKLLVEGHEAVVVLGGQFLLLDLLVLTLEQLLGRLSPGTEVVLVEDHEVPVGGVDPLVLRLDEPGLPVSPEQVLERTEVDQRPSLVRLIRATPGSRGEVLPAVEVGVRLQVGLPGVLHGGLEGHHEDALRAEPLCELVGGEGLPEAHLGVPQEPRHRLGILGPDRLVVALGLVHGAGLLRAHRERLVVGATKFHAGAKLSDRRAHIVRGAAHPLSC
jgi:hypothetical protein